MKRYLAGIIVLCMVLAGTLKPSSVAGNPGASLRVSRPLVDLEAVVEGQTVRHEFILNNDGDGPLRVTDAQTDCGCTAVDYDRTIAAGAEGRLVAMIDTNGYGGQAVTRRITLLTNDPLQPRRVLELRFNVARLFTLAPAFAKLEGPAGSRVETQVKIRPEDGYRFRILEVRAKSGRYIDVHLDGPTDEDGSFTLTVINRRGQKGRYFDRVLLKTDSPYRPEIAIGVFGNIG